MCEHNVWEALLQQSVIIFGWGVACEAAVHVWGAFICVRTVLPGVNQEVGSLTLNLGSEDTEVQRILCCSLLQSSLHLVW